MPLRRCFPLGSSEAAFCGVLQGRRGDASRWARPRRAFCGVFQRRRCAQRRRSLLSFSPRRPGNGCRASVPAHANRRAVPTLFHIFPARPSRASSFTLPPAIGYRVRTPRRCFPMGSSEAAFCGVLQGRRDDACRWARPRRASTGFSNAAAAVLPDGLVRGGLLRAFAGPPRRCFPKGSSEAAFHGIFQRRRCAQRRRSLLSFSPRRPAVLLSLPSSPASDTARHFSCIHLSRRTAGTAPLSLPPARVAEQRAPFSPYRRRARHCTSFSTPRRPPPDAAHGRPIHPDRQDNPSSLSHASGRRARPCEPAGSPFYFHSFPRASRASGRRPRTAHSPCSCARLLLFAAAPVRGCSRRISPSISAPLCLPRSPLLCARPFRAGFFGSALPCSPPPRAVSGPVPARADASRRSFAFPLARRAPFLPCAPRAPGLCASRRGGESCKASCCALLHARPALKQRARNRRPASASPRARPVRPPRTPGTSVPPRTPGASVPLLAAVRFGSHSAVQSRSIFFHRPAGKRTRKANLIRTYVRIRF